MQYDEEAELWRYIWRNFTHLMTHFEQRAALAAIVQEKATTSKDGTMARMLSERSGAFDPYFDSALSAGAEAFRRAVCRRILSEWGGVMINRWSRCRRIVRTPEAQQCFWCGHDWHGAARHTSGETTDG